MFAIPRVPGSGRRLRALLDEWPNLESGRAPIHLAGGESPIGPGEDESGQSIGPRADGSSHAIGPAGSPAIDAAPDVDEDRPPAPPNAHESARSDAALRWADVRRRYAEQLRTAERYVEVIRRDRSITTDRLGAAEGISGSRVLQLLALLRLDESIRAEITDPLATSPLPTTRELLRLARMASPSQQVAEWQRITRAIARGDDAARPPRQRGYQHLFAQARAWRAAMDAGEHRSLAALGRAVGVSHKRVCELLDLLQLCPEVAGRFDRADVKEEVAQKELYRIARLPAGEQVAALERVLNPPPPPKPVVAPAPMWARSIRVWAC